MQPEQVSRTPDRLIEWTGERCVPWTGDLQVVYEHYHRYLLARPLVEGKRVLDLASGEGYGAALLAESAVQVVGLEIDPASVAHSRQTYSSDSLEFVEGSMLELSRFPDGSFDVITCFEALEHVAEHEELITGVRRVLSEDGVFLTSTPDRLVYSDELHQHNPHHVRELSLAELRELLDAHFPHVRYWGQAVAVGSLVQPVDEHQPGGADVLALAREGEKWVERGGYAPTYYLAAASGMPLPELPSQSVLVDVDLELVRSVERTARSREDATHTRDAMALAKVQEYLVVSEESVEYLTRELNSTRRGAAVKESVLHERLDMVEVRVAAESALAHEAETALTGIRGSRAFRVVGLYYRFVEKFAPAHSRRRRAHEGATRSAALAVRRLRPLTPPPPAPIVLPTSDTPVVSIVIPVHGQWDYTDRCLRAVAATVGDVQYEVIVVDDASPDRSAERLRQVQGVRIVSLVDNVGFVDACNAGIASCQGEYVVLLNNDTRVHPSWLVPLVETISEPGIGLVGSRLVYPDGRLQDAGGIVFSDGSGWNYGKFGDPENPAYTYRRDVDYCSGACILLRKSTLDELGNLDTRFAPAYYDDTDLAFAVRELGLRVVYEPRSLVIHDEGITHGTDESAGVKAYQAVNKEKFVEKWHHRLGEQCAPDAANVPFGARRRNGERIVVVIDHYVPRPDEDSGSVRMMGMLRTLRQLGYGVLFVPDNRIRTEPWTGVLTELGVEVFYGHGDLPGRLSELSEHIHAVIVSRVTVAWTYSFMLRTILPEVPVVFDTVDLHFLREERGAKLAGDVKLSPRAKTLKALELAIAQSSDTTIVVSPYEQELLRKTLPGIDVKVVPNIHMPEVFSPTTDGRAGLLFVGSFAHHPNADGLRWFFSDILPLIEQRIPGVLITVVGRDPDPDLVVSAPANVAFLGWVEDVTPLYDHARIAIAPLRYGAGVKGKIGEAMAHGVPVVMTPVGAEGMSLTHGETAWIAQDAESFAEGIITLLTDDEYWHRLSKSGAHHIDAFFGSARFAALLEEVLQ